MEDRVVILSSPPRPASLATRRLPLLLHTTFVSSRLSRTVGRWMRKQRQGGGARPTSSPRTHACSSLAATLFLSPVILGWHCVSHRHPPFSPFVPTVPLWPARAISRVQRTPRFALRSSRAFLPTAIFARSSDLVVRSRLLFSKNFRLQREINTPETILCVSFAVVCTRQTCRMHTVILTSYFEEENFTDA